MAEGFRCVVATPTRELFSGTVYYADVPGRDGRFGVLRGHQSIVALNHEGGKLTLHLDPDGNEKKTFLAVLGRFGCDPDEIDIEDVKAKAADLRTVLEERIAKHDADPNKDVYTAADRAGIDNQKTHLSWYEAQIAYCENNR